MDIRHLSQAAQLLGDHETRLVALEKRIKALTEDPRALKEEDEKRTPVKSTGTAKR